MAFLGTDTFAPVKPPVVPIGVNRYAPRPPGPGVSFLNNPTPLPPAAAPPTPAAPDWAAILANNPYLLAQQALDKEQLAALKAQMGASAARALINLGDYSLANSLQGINLPSDTSALVDQANKSGTSLLSQLAYQHGLNQQAIPTRLAGRGFGRSGEVGYELSRENRGFGLRQEQGRQQTLDYLNGLYNQYLNAQFGIAQGDLNATLQAYQTALASGAAYPAPTSAATQASATPAITPAAIGGGPSLAALKQQLGYGTAQPWTAGL